MTDRGASRDPYPPPDRRAYREYDDGGYDGGGYDDGPQRNDQTGQIWHACHGMQTS